MRCKLTIYGAALACALLFLAAPGRTSEDKKAPPKAAAPATIIIHVPDSDAEVEVAGNLLDSTGEKRSYKTLPLPVGKTYSYTIKVVWEPNNYTKITRKRTVRVKAGEEVVADLRKAEPGVPDGFVIRYVPTPDDVVAAMCKLGKVGKDDVVFDLGCGDGRMVIHAVEKFGAKRGVGIDLDPVRIKESIANAKKAKVTDKVQFRVGDVTKVKDMSSATVVLLYMGDHVNMLLRPILQKTLPPGARIVSHRFEMGDWAPTKTEKIKGEDGDEYLIHLWTIPAKKK